MKIVLVGIFCTMALRSLVVCQTPNSGFSRVNVSSGVEAVTRIKPMYSSVARQARIEGTVILEAHIDREGNVVDLQVVSGHPLLVPAAIDAVKQWKYKPYLLNAMPVDVQTQIAVNFRLSEDVPKVPPKTQNIPPQEMWKRVKQCVFPAHALVPGNAYLAGTVELGLLISKDGRVVDYNSIGGDSPLRTLALHALRQWTFEPNLVEGTPTLSRIRAVGHFNDDGTTSIELTRALIPDDFGDPGVPGASSSQQSHLNSVIVPKPVSAPQCKAEIPWISAREADAN